MFFLKQAKKRKERKREREKENKEKAEEEIRGGKGTIVSSIQERSIYGRYSKKKRRTGILGL